jgi:hypothetical protein
VKVKLLAHFCVWSPLWIASTVSHVVSLFDPALKYPIKLSVQLQVASAPENYNGSETSYRLTLITTKTKNVPRRLGFIATQITTVITEHRILIMPHEIGYSNISAI